MTPLVSVMIPSRKRIAGLRNTINRLAATSTSPDYEVLVRFDDDDAQSVAEVGRLEREGVRCFVGSRLNGYRSLDEHFFAQLENEARSPWVWISGDDMDVQGDWLGQLRTVPRKGYIVQPEISMLNASVYPRAEAQAFPIFPRHCWKAYSTSFPRPFDTQGDRLLKQNGWKTWFLSGVTFIHNEALPHELAEHHRML